MIITSDVKQIKQAIRDSARRNNALIYIIENGEKKKVYDVKEECGILRARMYHDSPYRWDIIKKVVIEIL